MKVSIVYLITFILRCGLVWRIPYPVSPWLLYESFYKLLNYFLDYSHYDSGYGLFYLIDVTSTFYKIPGILSGLFVETAWMVT